MDVGKMTMWEFACARQGHIDANTTEEAAPAMSDDKAAELGIEGF